MALRKAFIKSDNPNKFVNEELVEFEWYPGFSKSQKQKSIQSLHNNINNLYQIDDNKILEISTKSNSKLGNALSAFNLKLKLNGIYNSVEVFFQSSKVFDLGGPYVDILQKSSIDAKRDERLKESGRLLEFNLFNDLWELEPKTLFYDWLYLNAVYQNEELANDIIKFQCFTDIEFNHTKSFNCQARSAALFVSLYHQSLLNDALKSKENYIDIVTEKGQRFIQQTLF